MRFRIKTLIEGRTMFLTPYYTWTKDRALAKKFKKRGVGIAMQMIFRRFGISIITIEVDEK